MSEILCDFDLTPPKLERQTAYTNYNFWKQIQKDSEKNTPKHRCVCGADFICSIVSNGHICKCKLKYKNEYDKNKVLVRTPYYFCDMYCMGIHWDEV